MYSCGPLQMAEQRQDVKLELSYSSSTSIRDVTLRTCRKQWTVGKCGARGSEISVLIARHDDDDDDDDEGLGILSKITYEENDISITGWRELCGGNCSSHLDFTI